MSQPLPPAPALTRLDRIFEATVDRHPGEVAVDCDGARLTYADLDHRVNQLAHHLRADGVGRGDTVALFLPRSVEHLVALLAVLKAGAAYVPLDPAWPLDRVRAIAADAGAKAVLAVSAAPTGIAGELCLDRESARLAAQPAERPAIAGGATDLAYVIYTSGSTGRPKGVAIEHGAAAHLVHAEREIFAVQPGDRVYHGFSIAFDASVEEIWLAFASGARLVLHGQPVAHAGPELARRLSEAQVTVFSTVPTLLALMTEDVPSLRLLISGGEALPPELVRAWWRPGRRVVNTYGPTEATVIATWTECTPGAPVTIGRAVPGYQVYVLDEAQRPVAPGETGEIHIGGPALARGYLGRPDLTAASFISSPFEPPPARVYRTGDLGRVGADGSIAFAGRADGQVKLRGFRVELGEVEAALAAQPGIRAACAAVRDDPRGGSALVGYLIADGDLDERALRRRLHQALPRYMVPAHLVQLTEFPRLASGKVDRQRLPAPPVSAEAEATDGSPEERMRAVWARVLGTATVGLDDDFFLDLGGHSLSAARLISELRRIPGGGALSVADVYRHPTIRALAAGWPAARPAAVRRRAAPAAAPRWRYAACVAAQAAALYPLFGLQGAQWLVPFAVRELIRAAGGPELWALAAAVGSLVLIPPIMLMIAILTKWLVVGRFRAGRYPVWGREHLRFWIVRRVLALAPVEHLAGTPLMPLFCRLMGAKVGEGVHIATRDLVAYDLLELGDGASVGTQTMLTGYALAGGTLTLGPIAIGAGAQVGCRAAIEPGAVIEDGGQLDDMSLLPAGGRIGPGERHAGSPARRAGERPRPEHTVREADGLGRIGAREWRSSPARRRLAAAGYALAAAALPLVLAVSLVPGLVLLDRLQPDSLAGTLLALPALAAAFVVSLALEIALLKWLLLGRVSPGRHARESWFAVRKWFVERLLELSVEVLRPLYATVFTPAWFRLLGARVGRDAEISTLCGALPDLCELGDRTFVADAAFVATERFERGAVTRLAARIGARSFLGNSAFVPAGAHVGEEVLIGVLSASPGGAEAATGSWLGTPALRLPARQASAVHPEEVTYHPPRSTYLARGAFEIARILVPTSVTALVSVALFEVMAALAHAVSPAAACLAGPLVYAALAAAAALFVAGAKWLLIGRFRAGAWPLWSSAVWRTELVTALHESVAEPLFLRAVLGTPLAPAFFRMLGARIGRRVVMETPYLTEYDLIELGDDVLLDWESTVQTHLFEDRVMKTGAIRIDAGASVGPGSIVLYDATLERGAALGALSLVMKGERLPAATSWHGAPARQLAQGRCSTGHEWRIRLRAPRAS